MSLIHGDKDLCVLLDTLNVEVKPPSTSILSCVKFHADAYMTVATGERTAFLSQKMCLVLYDEIQDVDHLA